MGDSLNVYLNGKHTGILQKDGNGGIKFQYAPDSTDILSLSLPLQSEEYINTECKGFFNGLLPESEKTRVAIGKKYGINPKNDFSILQSIGYDCAGAVSFFENKPKNIKEFYELEADILSENELAKFIEELPQKPLGTAIKGMRLSLAGAQDKTAVTVIDGKIGLSKNNVPTTHILKPVINGLNETVENEYICMISAKKLGIYVPAVEIGHANDKKYFLIERYDRVIENGKIKRIHQEDFCQASNIVSAYKYQADGGVDFKKCFEILRKTTNPAVSIKRFIELMIFNHLIGNNDAHGKNFSILHIGGGRIELAPAYDIMCSQVYKGLSNKSAMKIGGHYEHNKIFLRHFEELCKDVGINFTIMKKIIKNQCEILPEIIKEASKECENTIGNDILAVAEKNCKRLLSDY